MFKSRRILPAPASPCFPPPVREGDGMVFRLEHARAALSGPFKVRVGVKAGVLIGVEPNTAPTFWDHLEPDGWPVPAAAEARLDDARVARLLQAGPFAAPVGRSEPSQREQTLLDAGARRWSRGKVVPTVACLVVLGDQPVKHPPGCAGRRAEPASCADHACTARPDRAAVGSTRACAVHRANATACPTHYGR